MIDKWVTPVLIGFVAAELAAAAVSVPLGAALHAAVVVVALTRYVLATDEDSGAPLLPVVALLSGGRLVAMALPVPVGPATVGSVALRAAIVGAPAVLGALMLLRLAREAPQPVAAPAQRRLGRVLVTVALVAVPLGALAAVAQRLHAPVFTHPAVGYPATALSLALFSAGAEELGFRRLLMPAAGGALGRRGAWCASTLLFTATYLGSRSLAVVAVAAAGGLLFTWGYERSRSAVVPIVGHAVATVGAFLIWPALIR